MYHMSMRKGWERWGCSVWRVEGSGVSDQCVPTPDWKWEIKKIEPDSSQCSPEEVYEHKLKLHVNINKFFCIGGDQAVAQVPQRGCRVSMLGDIQNPTGHSPGQLPVRDPVLSRGVRLGDLQRSRPASTIL